MDGPTKVTTPFSPEKKNDSSTQNGALSKSTEAADKTMDVGPINIVIPFPSKMNNDDLPRARQHHLDWVSSLNLWTSKKIQAAYEVTDFPAFIARTYPTVYGVDADLINDFIGMTWLMDDAFDGPGIRKALPKETARRLEDYRRVVQEKMTHPIEERDTLLVAGFQDVMTRVNKLTSKTWRERHDPRWVILFDAFQKEAENNATGSIPTFENYIQMRRDASGTDICVDWIEATCHYELPVHIHANPLVLGMREDAVDVIIMTNDIFSARNEWKGGNTDNIIFVLANQEQCSWRRASELTHEIIAQKIASFQKSEKLLLKEPSYKALAGEDRHNVGLFIEGLKDWMRGSLDWHITCPRYQQ